MDPNPYAAPQSAEIQPAKKAASRTQREEKWLTRLSRLGIVLLLLSPVLYFSGIVLMFSADNPPPEKARPLAIAGEILHSSAIGAVWLGLAFLTVPFVARLPRSD